MLGHCSMKLSFQPELLKKAQALAASPVGLTSSSAVPGAHPLQAHQVQVLLVGSSDPPPRAPPEEGPLGV